MIARLKYCYHWLRWKLHVAIGIATIPFKIPVVAVAAFGFIAFKMRKGFKSWHDIPLYFYAYIALAFACFTGACVGVTTDAFTRNKQMIEIVHNQNWIGNPIAKRWYVKSWLYCYDRQLNTKVSRIIDIREILFARLAEATGQANVIEGEYRVCEG